MRKAKLAFVILVLVPLACQLPEQPFSQGGLRGDSWPPSPPIDVKSHPELRSLDPWVGEWTGEAQITGPAGSLSATYIGVTEWSQDQSYLINRGRGTAGNESTQYLGFVYWDQEKAKLIVRSAASNGYSATGVMSIADDGTSITTQYQFVDEFGRQGHGVHSERMIGDDTTSFIGREYVGGQEVVSTGTSRLIGGSRSAESGSEAPFERATNRGFKNRIFAPECSFDSLNATDKNLASTLAVLDFDVGEHLGVDVGKAMADLCRDLLQRKRLFILLDRERIAAVLGEQDFVAAVHCDNTKCLVEYGRLLGATRMMHGRINKLGDLLVLTIAVTDVNTGVQTSRSKTLSKVDEAISALPILVCEIVRDATRVQ